MGRKLMRVALDFDHPPHEVWPGYICDVGRRCSACGGRGTTTARDRLVDLVSLIMLSGDDARRERCHPYFRQCPLSSTSGQTPSRDMAELTVGLAGREASFLGHDCLDQHAAMKKIVAAAGLPDTSGRCKACEGRGDDPSTRAASEAWEPTDPPSGSGWQMWETVSEGSPISPVFETAEALGWWLANTGAAPSGRASPSYEDWMKMILGPGWAPTAVIIEGKAHDGVTAVGLL